MAGSTAETGGFVYRDRDPPPTWNGEKPESTLKPFLKDFQPEVYRQRSEVQS